MYPVHPLRQHYYPIQEHCCHKESENGDRDLSGLRRNIAIASKGPVEIKIDAATARQEPPGNVKVPHHHDLLFPN